MQKQLLLIALFLVSAFSFSQDLKGKITDASTANQSLPGASVQWLNTQIGTITDENGEFSIPYSSENTQLIISFVGFETDTLTVNTSEYIKHSYVQPGGFVFEPFACCTSSICWSASVVTLVVSVTMTKR